MTTTTKMATKKPSKKTTFNICLVGQSGRLQYEALLFVASLRLTSPQFTGQVFVAEPQPGMLWTKDPRIKADIRARLEELGAQILPFESVHFGVNYPNGNKIECLRALPKGEPFVFFDSDTLITDEISDVPFDFDKPSASLKREGTWPKLDLYGPGYTEIWSSLYSRFKLDFASSLDMTQPDEYWQRYLYFNAGFFFFRCPYEFANLFEDYAVSIRDNPPPELVCQSFDPWLDQIALPLVIHALGGGRDSLPPGYLDAKTSCHYRLFPLLYARETDRTIKVLEEAAAPNKNKKLLKGYDPIKRMVYQGRGQKVRALFDQGDLPAREQAIRNKIKSEGLWMR